MSDMSFADGLLIGSARVQAARERGEKGKTFDWDKAAELIRDRRPTRAEAGLQGDWNYTGGTIYEDGQIVTDSYTYLASMWATPQIDIDGERIDCFIEGLDSDSKWPESARQILGLS